MMLMYGVCNVVWYLVFINICSCPVDQCGVPVVSCRAVFVLYVWLCGVVW